MNASYADTLLVNGRIATLDPLAPEASAVAIREGRFLAVGDDRIGERPRRTRHQNDRPAWAARSSRD